MMYGAPSITRPTRVLSLGERMKCEFIMAMLHHPKVVFLDEPTINEFMTKLSQQCAFSDISIKEMPMETIITHIYQSRIND